MSHTKLQWVGHLFTYVKEIVVKILNNGCVYTYNAVRVFFLWTPKTAL